jgi:hypothetical protein
MFMSFMDHLRIVPSRARHEPLTLRYFSYGLDSAGFPSFGRGRQHAPRPKCSSRRGLRDGGVTRPSKKVSPRKLGAAFKVTENQRVILLRLFAGSLEREIAAETERKTTTIFNTVLRVRAQLGARTEYDLMRECIRRKIVTLDEIYALADAIRPPAAERSPDELG